MPFAYPPWLAYKLVDSLYSSVLVVIVCGTHRSWWMVSVVLRTTCTRINTFDAYKKGVRYQRYVVLTGFLIRWRYALLAKRNRCTLSDTYSWNVNIAKEPLFILWHDSRFLLSEYIQVFTFYLYQSHSKHSRKHLPFVAWITRACKHLWSRRN